MQLGNIQGNNYQVIEGLKPGERIVVSGLLSLRDGVPILPEENAQRQEGQGGQGGQGEQEERS